MIPSPNAIGSGGPRSGRSRYWWNPAAPGKTCVLLGKHATRRGELHPRRFSAAWQNCSKRACCNAMTQSIWNCSRGAKLSSPSSELLGGSVGFRSPVRVWRFAAGPTLLTPLSKLVFSRVSLILLVVACCIAALVVVRHLPRLTHEVQTLWATANAWSWFTWLAMVAAIKTLHEAGHLLAAVRAGVRGIRVGTLLLCGLPTMSCARESSERTATA